MEAAQETCHECSLPFIVSSVLVLHLLERDAIAELKILLDRIVNTLQQSAEELIYPHQ